jgi:hypothetical protein
MNTNNDFTKNLLELGEKRWKSLREAMVLSAEALKDLWSVIKDVYKLDQNGDEKVWD